MLQVDRNPAQTSLSKNKKVILHRAEKSRDVDECRDPKAVTKTRLPAAWVAIFSKEKHRMLREMNFREITNNYFF